MNILNTHIHNLRFHIDKDAPADYMKRCSKIDSVGRIKWFGNMTGKDNCSWYLFGSEITETKFYGR